MARKKQPEKVVRSRECGVCCHDFTPVEQWELFCSHVCRLEAWERRGFTAAEQICTYCGAPADTEDHVPPVSTMAVLEDLGEVLNVEQLIVPACRECNCVILGDRPLWTLAERQRYVAMQLPIYHKILLETPEWDADELDEMSLRMQQYIVGQLGNVTIIKNRIAFASAGRMTQIFEKD